MFHGYESKMEYAISKINLKSDDRNIRSEADQAIGAYTQMLPNGIDSLHKKEIDSMCDEIWDNWYYDCDDN